MMISHGYSTTRKEDLGWNQQEALMSHAFDGGIRHAGITKSREMRELGTEIQAFGGHVSAIRH